jgi:hypothetical protein
MGTKAALSAIDYGDGDDFPHKGAMPKLDWPHRLSMQLAQLRNNARFQGCPENSVNRSTGERSPFDLSKLTDEQLEELEGRHLQAWAGWRVARAATRPGHCPLPSAPLPQLADNIKGYRQ